jgi:hypothetical protein
MRHPLITLDMHPISDRQAVNIAKREDAGQPLVEIEKKIYIYGVRQNLRETDSWFNGENLLETEWDLYNEYHNEGCQLYDNRT